MSDAYDLVVIGTGPGGYVCAIRAAQLGMRVAVVERRATFGGTCLNIGCIPSKAMLHTSELFHEAGHGFARLGIKLARPKLDLKTMMAHKDETVKANVDGVAYLFRKNKIDTWHGTGRVKSADEVLVLPEKGEPTTLKTGKIVIATGSDSAMLPGLEIDEKRIVTSTGALELPRVPGKLLVIGAGVIGLELGSVWKRLGAEVVVVEFLDRILPGMDGEIGKQFRRILERQGIGFQLSSRVTAVDTSGKTLKATVEPAAGEAASETHEADVVLVSIGRVPRTDGLGLEDAGVELDERGRVRTDSHFRTNIDGIHAIGDVIAGPMLAHKAEDEGIAVAEMLAGQSPHVNYNTIPNVVYTWPEVASVGKTEEELKDAGVRYTTGKFPFTANGRARAMMATDGFVKFLADAETDEVLGCHIIGAGAGEMIHEVCVLMEYRGAAEDLARICHAHPTMSEAVREAALAVDKRPIHI